MSVAETKIVFQGSADIVTLNTVVPDETTNNASSVSAVSKFLFSYGRKQQYRPGQYIIREGDRDKRVYVILKGEVEVLKRDQQGNENVVTTLTGGGAILGEMSIFLDEARSTSVRIVKDTLALEFTGENFLNAVANIPELSMRMLKCLSNRVKSANEKMVQVNEPEKNHTVTPQAEIHSDPASQTKDT